jgi:hypothetical protein
VPKSDTHNFKSNVKAGQPKSHGKKGCNDVHFEGIRDKKKFANAADARDGGPALVRAKKARKQASHPGKLLTLSVSVTRF